MYDDPPREDNFVNPYFRDHKTPVFKTDHPDQSFKVLGEPLTRDRTEQLDYRRERQYEAWSPPSGKESRIGKKILVDKPKFNFVNAEQD